MVGILVTVALGPDAAGTAALHALTMPQSRCGCKAKLLKSATRTKCPGLGYILPARPGGGGLSSSVHASGQSPSRRSNVHDPACCIKCNSETSALLDWGVLAKHGESMGSTHESAKMPDQRSQACPGLHTPNFRATSCKLCWL